MKKLIALAVVASLAACANTGVVLMDQHTYMISKDSAKFGGGISMAVRAEVYQEAGAFCAKEGKAVDTLDLMMLPGRPGQLGNVTLQFQCIDKSLAGAKPIRLEERGSVQVIEVRQR